MKKHIHLLNKNQHLHIVNIKAEILCLDQILKKFRSLLSPTVLKYDSIITPYVLTSHFEFRVDIKPFPVAAVPNFFKVAIRYNDS